MSSSSPAPGESRESTPVSVHLGLLTVQLSFGGFHVVAKGVLTHLDPLALVGIRVACATPLLLLWAWIHDRKLPAWKDLPYLALLGLLGVFLNQVLYILGLERTQATSAAVLMPSIPVFAVAVGALLGVEAATRRRSLGVILTVVGALVVLQPAHLLDRGSEAFGNTLILINCLSYATFLVVQRPLLRRLPWRTVIAWAFLFGGTGVLGVSAPSLAATPLDPLPVEAWLGVGYIILFPTVLSYSLATWAVKRSSPSLVAAYVTLQPIFAGALGAIFLAEEITWRLVAGFLLILGGLALISRRRRSGQAQP
ncbi:MAG: DMT family transporter [Thermoanaerobaculia bacterium]|nr:DMT family transporter [Thermoanaerobaculia bacterium]